MTEKAVEGIEDVLRHWRDAPKHIIPGALLKALQAAGWVLEGAIELRTPVGGEISGEHAITGGELISDLDMTITIDDQFRGGIVQVGFGKLGYIARFVEYGHRMVGHEPGKKPEGQVEPRPFMRTAAAESEQRAVDVFTETFLAELQKGELIDAA